MNKDAASLDNLRDIVESPPVSWWPLAPGWWVLLIALAIVTIIAVNRIWNQWKANAYRRSALKGLEMANSLAAIDGILKRTALAAYPRTRGRVPFRQHLDAMAIPNGRRTYVR